MKKIQPITSELKIIIPTYKRETVKQQVAYSMIPQEFRDRTYFLIREEQHELMMRAFPHANYLLIPKGEVVCLSDTRQWALKQPGFEKQWHFDDDVKLFGKRDSMFRIRGKISTEEFRELYNLVSQKLDEYCYVGLSARLFNNLKTTQFDENYACYTCFAMRADVLNSENARFDELLIRDPRVTIAEDKWMCTYLLSKGYKNIILNEWVYDQKEGEIGSDAANLGGCYGHKTKLSNQLATDEFIRSFPGCVYSKTQNLKDKHKVIIDSYQYPIIRWKKVYETALAKQNSLIDPK